MQALEMREQGLPVRTVFIGLESKVSCAELCSGQVCKLVESKLHSISHICSVAFLESKHTSHLSCSEEPLTLKLDSFELCSSTSLALSLKIFARAWSSPCFL